MTSPASQSGVDALVDALEQQQQKRKRKIQRVFRHVATCSSTDCQSRNCAKVKGILPREVLSQSSFDEKRKRKIQRVFRHAATCSSTDGECHSRNCAKVKGILRHFDHAATCSSIDGECHYRNCAKMKGILEIAQGWRDFYGIVGNAK